MPRHTPLPALQAETCSDESVCALWLVLSLWALAFARQLFERQHASQSGMLARAELLEASCYHMARMLGAQIIYAEETCEDEEKLTSLRQFYNAIITVALIAAHLKQVATLQACDARRAAVTMHRSGKATAIARRACDIVPAVIDSS